MSKIFFAAATAVALTFSAPVTAADNPQVANEVMALARAQWAAEIANAPVAAQYSTVADDYTEFNPEYPTLIVGKPMAMQMAAVVPNDKAMFSDMQNPRVQVYGDTAILTYNFAGLRRAADGKVTPSLAKSTRVYAKLGGQWRLVHANFAPLSAGQ